MEEVSLAAQGLTEVTSLMKQHSTLARSFKGTMLVQSDSTKAHIKEAFGCLKCRSNNYFKSLSTIKLNIEGIKLLYAC